MNKFRKGDTVVCINNEKYESFLTLNKVYKIFSYDRLESGLETYSDYIKVLNDNNTFYYYLEERFLMLSEWRDKQLNELGI
jgi:hypothetical protein